MGIDIYAHWKGQGEKENEAQATGFSTEAGDVGYLREAYHGAPYVTKYLVAEGFDGDYENGTPIPASVMRERLPTAVLMAMYRENKLYGGGKDPSMIDLDKMDGTIKDALAGAFSSMKDASHETFASELSEESKATGKRLINIKALRYPAKAFVDFVELCERKEKETGEPCRISVSA